MIRACLAAAIVLVAAWTSSALILARVDERHSWQSVTSAEAGRHLPVSVDPVLVAMGRVRPMLSLRRFESLATAFEESDYEPAHPDLALTVATAPAPRPATVATTRPQSRPGTPEQIVTGARISPPPASLRNASDLSCLAVAIYHEARDQEDFGQRAVASVILQRTEFPRRWGRRACDNVVPVQFSFMTSRYDYPPITDRKAWEKAVRFAAQALLDGPMRELKGADHYHTAAVSPAWAPEMVRVRVIGDHIFYVDRGSSSSL